jgi:uncharacterized protein (TIGR02118 family)
MDYYLSTHMPLVLKNWGPYGLKSYSVVEFGPDADFCVQATLDWESEDSPGKALKTDTVSTVMGDVPNFSDKSPVLMNGKVTGTS